MTRYVFKLECCKEYIDESDLQAAAGKRRERQPRSRWAGRRRCSLTYSLILPLLVAPPCTNLDCIISLSHRPLIYASNKSSLLTLGEASASVLYAAFLFELLKLDIFALETDWFELSLAL